MDIIGDDREVCVDIIGEDDRGLCVDIIGDDREVWVWI